MNPFQPQTLPLKELSWEPLIPFIGRANRALAHYDGVLLGVPNPEVLLSPLTTEEAVLSSRIEGTQATLGEVYRFEAGDAPEKESRRQDINEILNYRQALWEAERALLKRPFNLNLLLRLHEILLDSVRGENKARGRFRTDQNWIGVPGTSIKDAAFVPPIPAALPILLDNWEKYYHSDTPDALVQLALVHAQFEILHPFLDGNGRLGRILIPLFLHEKKILHRPMFYLSAWLEARRDTYINHLRPLGVKPGSWNQWVIFFLTGLEEQARINSEKARKILDLYESLKIRALSLTHSQYAVPLLDQMFKRPVFKSSRLKFGDSPPTRGAVAKLVRALKEGNVIKVLREGSGRRGTIYCFPDLINLCERKQVVGN
jgi:Fic family protein